MLPVSRQEKIDRIMCKPGYTYNDVVGRCLMGGMLREGDKPSKPEMPKPEQPAMPSPDTAVQQEKAARMSS